MSGKRDFQILVINPGSTSTKVAVFRNSDCLFSCSYSHSSQELAGYSKVLDQYERRKRLVLKALDEWQVKLDSIDAIAARGGRLKPIPSGTYLVNERMMQDARRGVQGDHASNLACLIGKDLAAPLGIPVFVVDPVAVDELDDIARVSGIKEVQRTSLSHALNMKAIARKAAARLGKAYSDARLIVAHMGGGGSVSAHVGGRMIDLYNSDKEGAFTAERAGGIPTLELVDMCFSGRYTRDEIVKKLVGGGGLASYLGTKDAREVERRVESGDDEARLIFEAMAYQFAKSIGALATVLKGRVDAVVLTGGMAHSRMLVDWITERVSFIAPVIVFPGEIEMEALALGVLRVLTGEEMPKVYE